MIKYLMDENMNPLYLEQLRRRRPDLSVRGVGEVGTSPKGTLDPDILLWCEEYDCVLITNNRRSMPVHLSAHLATDHHCPGIFILNPNQGIGETIEELILIADGSFDHEYRDQILFLPLTELEGEA